MQLIALTNNRKVYEDFLKRGQEVIFIEGHAKKVIQDSFSWIYKGWKLAADPLAGYLSRPNPYHTIFIQESREGKVMGEHLLRLERTSEQWDKYDNIVPMTERLWKDYAELDYSIASSTLDGLVKNPVYFSSILV